MANVRDIPYPYQSSDWAFAEANVLPKLMFDDMSTYQNFSPNHWDRAQLYGTTQYLNRGVLSRTSKYTFQSKYPNYSGSAATAFDATNLNADWSTVNYNLTAAIIDTLVSKVASLDVIPQAVTDRANAKGRQLAEDLNHLIRGLHHNLDLHKWKVACCKDAIINGVGYIYVGYDPKCGAVLERVLPDEIIVDANDGYYNNPYKMIRRRLVPLAVMLKKYPEHTEAILNSEISDLGYNEDEPYTPCILVAEGWVRNSYKDKGRYVLATKDYTLTQGEWDKDYLPIYKFDYNAPTIGFVGPSLVDELGPLQTELNRNMATIQEICILMCIPTIFIDTASDVNYNYFVNKVGRIINYNGNGGNVPMIHNGASVPPELVRILETTKADMFSRAGVSPLDVQGQKPIGIDSGTGLRALTEIQNERWQYLNRNFESLSVGLIELIFNEIRGKKIEFSALDDHIGLRKVSSKIIPKRQDYSLQYFSTSAFPADVEGRTKIAKEYVQLGVLDPRRLPDLLSVPDISSYVTMQSSPTRYIDTSIENMLSSGKYSAPEEFDDLDYAEIAATRYYSFAKLNDSPEKEKSLLRRYLTEVRNLKTRRDQEVMLQNQQVQAQALESAKAQLAEQQKLQEQAKQQAAEEFKKQMEMEQEAEELAIQQLAQSNVQSIEKGAA